MQVLLLLTRHLKAKYLGVLNLLHLDLEESLANDPKDKECHFGPYACTHTCASVCMCLHIRMCMD